jgi:hypothetical protein
MGKRRKALKKKKRQLESMSAVEDTLVDQIHDTSVQDEPEDLTEPDFETDETVFDDIESGSEYAAPDPVPVVEKRAKSRESASARSEKSDDTRWMARNKENLLLGALILYVLLLGLGTAGELFEIEWILNLPIFK